jgi:hypothetical protein
MSGPFPLGLPTNTVYVKCFNIVSFYGEELLAPCPTPKLEDHLLTAVHNCLFNVLTATLLIWRPFVLPQPEDMPCHATPCHDDRDPLITDQTMEVSEIKTHKFLISIMFHFKCL